MDTAESLQERIRSLRLWADHLETRLANKTEQADLWRKRAEERKKRIDELQTALTGSARKTVRAFWKRLFESVRPETIDMHAGAQHTTIPEAQSRSEPRLSRLVHPTIRIGVAAANSSPIPPLLRRMNTTLIHDPSSSDQVRAVDLLVTVDHEGAQLAQSAEATRQWIGAGNPTVTIGHSIVGQRSVDIADLEYFDEDQDIFDIAPASHRPDLDPDLFPSIEALSRARQSEWTASIREKVGSVSDLNELERHTAGLLRHLRQEKSPRAVAERFLQASGVSVPRWRREALAALVSKRPDFVVEATDRITRQDYRPLRVAVGLHGPAKEAEKEVRQRLAETEIPHLVATFENSIPQGECLNSLVEGSPGDVILKIDDDDWYSPVFISDMMGALEFSGAAIVGKAAAFVRLRDGRLVLLRTKSYQEVDHVVGPTITAHRWAWESVRFPNRHERVDSKFLQAARSLGLRVVSHHPWDFCVIRHDRGHSWTASDNYFLSTGRLVDLGWEDILTG